MKKIDLGAILAISAFSTSFDSSSKLVSNEETNSKKVATSKSLQFHVPNTKTNQSLRWKIVQLGQVPSKGPVGCLSQHQQYVVNAKPQLQLCWQP
jgi:hypothetical protein